MPGPRPKLAARLKGEGLQQVLFNAPPGDWDAGERGIAGVPGPRGRLPPDDGDRRWTTPRPSNARASMSCRGSCPTAPRRKPIAPTSSPIFRRFAPLAKQAGVALTAGGAEPHRFSGLSGRQHRDGLFGDRGGRQRQRLPAIRSLSLPDDAGPPGAATMREKLGQIRHMQIAGVSGPQRARQQPGDQLPRPVRADGRVGLSGMGRAANTGRAAKRWRASPGQRRGTSGPAPAKADRRF